ILLFMSAGILVIKGFEPAVILERSFEPAATLESQNSEGSNIQNIGSSDIIPEEIQNSSEPEEIKLNFSGEVLTCSNITDAEQVVDVRLTNRDTENKSITIYPMDLTINLLPGQKKRIDIPLPHGISVLTLVSSDGKELKAQVPLCFSRGDSGSGTIDLAAQTTPNVKEIPEFPAIGLPVLSILALLFLVKKKIN
ncbi:MAG TPA: hypothetical protein VN368_03240, partial [Candidatus Methylomirabilis sp.]|nr:hypothetical protein [Candidatus Methylomirabilis sp.]